MISVHLALVCTIALQPAQTSPPRDSTGKPAKGAVSGRVTAAATDLPLHRVRITLTGGGPTPLRTVTDTRGAFELLDVPPGLYSLIAERGGYLTGRYGQRRPRDAGRTIQVVAGQTVDKIDIAMFRGGALSGRVTDELGDGVANARIEALEFRYVRGRWVSVPARITNTNEAGEYRLGGLEPGAYQIRATTVDVWEGDDGKSTFTYGATYFPGVSVTGQPQNVTVATGQEVPGLDFQLIPGRAAQITGVVEDTTGGGLAAQVVHLSRATRTVGGALLATERAGRTQTNAAGAFTFDKLAPGEYVVHSGGQSDRTSLTVLVGEGDVRHVVLTPRKQVGVKGLVELDDQGSLSFPPSRLRITVVPVDAESILPSFTDPPVATVKPDWTFAIDGLDGRYLFRVNGLPDDWMLKAVVVGGRDVADTPLDVTSRGGSVEGVRIFVSGKGAKVTGQVVDSRGRPAADSTVIVFPENPLLWAIGSRFIKTSRTDDEGHFSIAGLPGGAYRSVARDALAEGQWEDPEYLQAVFKGSAAVALRPNAIASITLTRGEDR